MNTAVGARPDAPRPRGGRRALGDLGPDRAAARPAHPPHGAQADVQGGRRRRRARRLRPARPARHRRAAPVQRARRGGALRPLDRQQAGRRARPDRVRRAALRPRRRPRVPAGRHRRGPPRVRGEPRPPQPRDQQDHERLGRGRPRAARRADGPLHHGAREPPPPRRPRPARAWRRTDEHHDRVDPGGRDPGRREIRVGDRIPWRLHPPPGPDDPVRAPAGHVPGRPRPEHRLHLDPHDRGRPARPEPAGLGHDGLPDHRDDLDAALRQALRPLRPQTVLPVRHRGLRRRLGALHPVDLDVRARRVPRAAGPRRRRSDEPRAHDHRRHRPAAGARPVPGLLPRRLRDLERDRPGRRRLLRRHDLDHRDRRLALGLPRQRPDRHRRLHRRVAGAEPAPQPARAADRLAGRRSPWPSRSSRC